MPSTTNHKPGTAEWKEEVKKYQTETLVELKKSLSQKDRKNYIEDLNGFSGLELDTIIDALKSLETDVEEKNNKLNNPENIVQGISLNLATEQILQKNDNEIEKYLNFISRLHKAYKTFCLNNTIYGTNLLVYSLFENDLKAALDKADTINTKAFLKYCQELVFNNPEKEKLEIYYNLISLKLQEAFSNLQPSIVNTVCDYPISVRMQKENIPENVRQFLYFNFYSNGIHYLPNEIIAAVDFLEFARKEVDDALNKISEIFAKKELPTIGKNLAALNHNGFSEKIKWNGKYKSNLKYLFWKLKRENVILENTNFALVLSQVFCNDDGSEISNKDFTARFVEYDKNTKFPSNAVEIDNLIATLKKV